VDGGYSGLTLGGEVAFDPPAQHLSRHIDAQNPDHRERRPGIDAMPMRLALVFAGCEPGFFLELARDAAWNIDRAVPDVVEVGRTGWKIDAPGVRRVLAHFTEHEGAVGAAQRAHAEAVEHARVGKAPVAPGQETCEIGFEIAGAEAVAGKYRVASKQDAAVPHRRLFALLIGEMPRDLGAPRFGKRPRPRLDDEVERADAMNDRRCRTTHRPTSLAITPTLSGLHFALAPVVFLTCSTYLLV
jgi:hypothetical protein